MKHYNTVLTIAGSDCSGGAGIQADIKGIGPKTKDALLKHFKSVRRIKEATVEELSGVIGESKGGVVFRHFHKK